MPVQVDLDTISTNTSNSAQYQHNMEQHLNISLISYQDNWTDCVTHRDERVNQRIADVEEVLKVQAVQVQASQLNRPGHMCGYRSSYPKALPPTRKHTQHLSSESPEGAGMQVTQHAACQPGCPCRCQSQCRSSTPGLIDRVFGRIFLHYAGLPFVNAKCDTDSYGKRQAANISVEYWFPPGFAWSNILLLELT